MGYVFGGQMTHEELLTKINNINSAIFDKDSDIPKEVAFYHNQLARKIAGTGVVSALRAVVELHKPKKINTGASTENGFEHWQEVCSKCIFPYPCQDIQAIEKELK